MRRKKAVLLSLIALILLYGCGDAESVPKYELKSVHPVVGRQGICTENGYYWVSGSGTLAKYDSDWNLLAENTEPFEGYSLVVNHIGDIDVSIAIDIIGVGLCIGCECHERECDKG